jgi:hypothetical protein
LAEILLDFRPVYRSDLDLRLALIDRKTDNVERDFIPDWKAPADR